MEVRSLRVGDLILDTPETEALAFGPCMVVRIYKEPSSDPPSKYLHTFEYLRGDGSLGKRCVYDWRRDAVWGVAEFWPEGYTGRGRDGSRFTIRSRWW